MAESQQKTIINLYNSGIPPDVIALQLDISRAEVDNVIASTEKSAKPQEPMSLASFYLDAIVDLDKSIKLAQGRVWKALKVESRFDISGEETDDMLARLAKSK